jgi:hypothetical protein
MKLFTPLSRALLEKVTVMRLVAKFSGTMIRLRLGQSNKGSGKSILSLRRVHIDPAGNPASYSVGTGKTLPAGIK